MLKTQGRVSQNSLICQFRRLLAGLGLFQLPYIILKNCNILLVKVFVELCLILSTSFLWFCQLHFSDSENVFLSAVFASLSEATIVAAIGREMSSLWCCNTSCGRTELYFLFLIWANTKYVNYTKYQTKYKIQILFNNTQNKILSQCITKYRIQILKYKIQKIKTKPQNTK